MFGLYRRVRLARFSGADRDPADWVVHSDHLIVPDFPPVQEAARQGARLAGTGSEPRKPRGRR